MVRSTAFYLLRQYFNSNRGAIADFVLHELAEKYIKIEKVNVGIVNRIQSISKADADANSVVILDALAKLLGSQIKNKLSDFDALFSERD